MPRYVVGGGTGAVDVGDGGWFGVPVLCVVEDGCCTGGVEDGVLPVPVVGGDELGDGGVEVAITVGVIGEVHNTTSSG